MTTKAARYADLLDDARCEGNWADVPELVRKVRKHDPARECLTLTAETECAISKVTAAGTQPTDLDVPNRLPKLMAVIEAETRPEERFQAQVCVGWLHWVVGEYTLALERLPKSLNEQYPDIDPANTASEWTSVCALKAAYLRANCLMRDGHRLPALAALQKGLPSLDRVWGGHGIRKQLRYWSELFLTEHCMLTSEALHSSEISLDDPNSISSFRSWAKYWKIMSAPVTGGFGFKGSVPRRRIWNEYYLALSRILENDLPYPTGQAEKMVGDMSARAQLRVELQRAEAAYQALLLGETAFPRADEERAEIETFIKQVMMNWSILCGRGWSEQDLGQGGRDLLSRTVLDTLYSAATRTYHSTAILRSLFNVHLSVAEFDLAFKALDSYLDIVKKGKARVAKTGHSEPSLDDDKTALETMSQGIMILCSYGHQQAAEKARHLGAELEDWLSKLPHNVQENGTPVIAEDKEESEVHSDAPPPQTVALAWQAIGLSHAHWSRITTEAGSRAEIQSKAIRCLRRSLAPEFSRSKDVRSFFSLGLLLAERRELATAIELVRSALIAVHGFEEDYNLFYGPYWQERSLIPLWHLLALLLSARQDYVMAARACEGALEQFKDPTVLFGKSDSGFRSEHLNDAEVKATPSRGLVDDMSDEEKVGILDVKMTQIALIELMEGPDVAVNASYELLTLFSRLFGNIDVQQQALKPPAIAEPPKTARTFKGSIFGSRADRSRPPTRQVSNATLGEKSTVAVRPATSHTTAPSIAPTVQVTAENGDGRERSGSVGTQTRRSESGRRNSLKKKTRSGSQRRRSSSAGGLSHQATVVGDSDSADHDFFSASGRRLQSRIANSSRGRTLSSLNSYLSTNSKYTDDSDLSTDISFTLPHLLPLIKFPKDKEKTQRTAILIKVWLMIAGFYRRAGMLEDCKGAVAEAQKLVHTLESEMAKDPASGSGSTRGPAWGEKKSIDELWGDVYSELGLLALAKETPYVARTDFESALTYYPDHPAAIVGLSNILLDIYSEKLLPTPAIPSLDGHEIFDDVRPTKVGSSSTTLKTLPYTPLGLVSDLSITETLPGEVDEKETPKAAGSGSDPEDEDELPEPYKAFHLPLVDRLAARDRAFTLLSGLTRLGTGWDYSDAWFALARAHEENGQVEKAREVLWWCVELEEAMGVRDWRSLAAGGYII